jgi:hypothetical protein
VHSWRVNYTWAPPGSYQAPLSTRSLHALSLSHVILYSLSQVDIAMAHRLIKLVAETQPPGAVLVFLPGWFHITRLQERLQQCAVLGNTKTTLVLPLHSQVGRPCAPLDCPCVWRFGARGRASLAPCAAWIGACELAVVSATRLVCRRRALLVFNDEPTQDLCGNTSEWSLEHF